MSAPTGKLGLAVRPSDEGLVENATGAAANGKPVKSVVDLRALANKAINSGP